MFIINLQLFIVIYNEWLINKGPEPSAEELKALLAELEESQPQNPDDVKQPSIII